MIAMQAPPPPDPPEILVTARALPEPAADSAYGEHVLRLPLLRDTPSSQLDQLLKFVPGLQLFRRSDARSSHPTSQGVTLRALGGNASSRALLVLDGVPQTDPFGGWINWPAYDPASLAEVRVSGGGGRVTEGPGALAGVIEMTSRVENALVAEASAGSRSSLESRVFAGLALGGGTLALSARGARGDGFVPITAETRGPADRAARYQEASLRAYWTTDLGGTTEFQLSALGFTDRRERGLPFTSNRTNGADASVRLVGRGPWQWSALAYAQWRDLMSSFASVSPGRATASRVSLQHSVPSQAFGARFEIRPPIGEKLELRLGADARLAEGETREFFNYVAGDPTRQREAGGNSLTAGLFSELAFNIGRLTLGTGARIDRWRISDGKLLESVIATGAPIRNDRFPARSGWLPTARAGAQFDAGRGASIRTAAYLGWRMPTLNELFRPFRAGPDATAANALLDPERVAGLEIGGDYRRGMMKLSVTAFVNRLSDAIANVTLGRGPGQFPGVGFVGEGGEFRQRQNLDAVLVRGVEASAGVRKGPFTASLGFSVSDAEVEADGPATPLDGLRPAQTPRLTISGMLGWDEDGRSLSLSVRHVGAQFEDDLNQQRLKPATTFDAFGAWKLGRRVQLFGRGENLLNERVVAGIGNDGSVERATPRTLWIGLRLSDE